MTNPSKHKRSFSTFGIPVILAFAAVLNMLLFQYKTSVWTKEWAYRVLDVSAQEQLATLAEIFNGRFGILETFANSLANQTDPPTLEDVTTRMNAIAEASDFESLAISGLDGVAYTSEAQSNDSSCRAAQKLEDSRLYKQNRLILAVPLYVDGEVAGVVMGSFSDSNVEKLLGAHAFSGAAYSFLCDSAGHIIVGAEKSSLLYGNDNVLAMLSGADAEFIGDTSLETMADDLQNERGGLAVYSIGSEKRYALYQPTGINDWYIFNVVPGEVVDNAVAEQSRLGLICIFVVALCSVLLLFIMAQREKNRIRELEQIQEAEIVRYRTDSVTELLNAYGFTHAVKKTLHTLPEEFFCAMVDFEIINFSQYNVSFGSPDAIGAQPHETALRTAF